jgi:hypothetical protein
MTPGFIVPVKPPISCAVVLPERGACATCAGRERRHSNGHGENGDQNERCDLPHLGPPQVISVTRESLLFPS